MTGEALLAWTHILAFLALAVFLSCEAALCHHEWMNESVVRRLARLDILYGISVARGAFGAPTFFVGDEMYFGEDRLFLVHEALK